MQIDISAADGTFTGYLAQPKITPAPGIVVLQEIFGVNKVMRDICDDLAQQGFLALCPDLFWRIEPHIDITDQSPEEWEKAFELFNAFDVAQGVEDIASAITTLRGLEGCNGKVGAMGFCLGGQLAYLTATRSDIDGACGFYGVNIQNHLNEATAIKKPLMLHMAGQDQFVPPEAQAEIARALENHSQVTLHYYGERNHAFARKGGEHYHQKDAEQAWKLSLDFLNKNLT